MNWEVLKSRTAFEGATVYFSVSIKVLLALCHSDHIDRSIRCFSKGCSTHELTDEFSSLIPIPSSTLTSWDTVFKLTSECRNCLVSFLLDENTPARWNTSSKLSHVIIYHTFNCFRMIMTKSNCRCFSSISLTIIMRPISQI